MGSHTTLTLPRLLVPVSRREDNGNKLDPWEGGREGEREEEAGNGGRGNEKRKRG